MQYNIHWFQDPEGTPKTVAVTSFLHRKEKKGSSFRVFERR